MRETITILDKVANEYAYLHCLCGGDFLKAIYDLFNCTEGVMDNECAKSFLQCFAETNNILWKDAVSYLYYMMKEAFPKFSEFNREDLDWSKLCCSESDSDMGKFMKIAGNEKYASKKLYETFCKRANIDTDDCVKESVIDAYGWKRVVHGLVLYVIEEHLSVEERYEDADLEETETFEIAEPPMTEVTADVVAEVDTAPTEQIVEYGKRAVKAICLDDGTEVIYKSISEVAKALGIKSCTVSNFKRGKKEYCRGKTTKKKYKFEFFDGDKGKILMVEPKTKEIVASYNKATEASKKWGLSYDTLQGKLKNRNPEFHELSGYEWWREKDYYKLYKAA